MQERKINMQEGKIARPVKILQVKTSFVRFGSLKPGKDQDLEVVWPLILQAGGTNFQSGQEVGRVPSHQMLNLEKCSC